MQTVLATDPRGHQILASWSTEQLMILPDIEALGDIYEFDNPKEVNRFLLKAGKPVIEVLKEAPSHIFALFGTVRLHLKAIRAPQRILKPFLLG
jgi:hypothetical protein